MPHVELCCLCVLGSVSSDPCIIPVSVVVIQVSLESELTIC